MARKTVFLNNTPFFIPPHTRGDREFGGHGPHIWVNTRLRVVESKKIKARIWSKFQEDRSDYTTSEGSIDVHVFDGTFDPEIDRINFIAWPGTSSAFYTHQDSGHEHFTRSENAGPVREYYLLGDTRGSEAGTRSGVQVRFRPVEIDFDEVEEPPERVVQVDVGPIEYMPPHTRGDRDFGGHGPNVTCVVRVFVRNQTQLWASVFMRASETRSDWTTASGQREFQLYNHRAPIAEILSDTVSSHFYRDDDHEEDVFTTSAGELVSQFTFVGDTRGDEAGNRTRVLVHFNPIHIREMT